MILLDFHNAFLLVAVLMNVLLGVIILFKRRGKLDNKIYFINLVCIIWWTVAIILYRSSNSPADLIPLAINLYLAPIFIASSFLYFSLFFPEQKVKYHLLKWLAIFVPSVLVSSLLFVPGSIIESVQVNIGSEHIISFGPLYWVYAFYISLNFCIGLSILAHRFSLTKKTIQRRQISYLLIGYLSASTLAMITNLILPWFGEFKFNWLGQGLTVLMVIPVAYAIFKHHLFSSRVIATELFIFILWALLLARTLLPQTLNDRLMNLTLFSAALIIGFLLIRSVYKEVTTREELSKLATELAGANAHLERIDKTKSEFLSIASHQLRSPLTSIRGYVSMILEGSYGEVNPKVREVLQHVSASSENMAMSIGDYLNISRIEAGNMKYDLIDCDVRKLVEATVAEIMPSSTIKKISLSFRATFSGSAMVKLDVGKAKQIIQNLIDNAIKYTPENGVITVLVSKDDVQKKILVKIIDTGIGISEEEIVALFEKFSRAKLASSVNVNGTGLGLYIAREMTRAMDGEITVASPGEGKGTTFIISFPLNGIESKWSTS